jgi:hypothetical protein
MRIIFVRSCLQGLYVLCYEVGMTKLLGILISVLLMTTACMSGVASFEGGNSEPLTTKESNLYKQSMIRCHKTGGTRVVKLNGKLRCF